MNLQNAENAAPQVATAVPAIESDAARAAASPNSAAENRGFVVGLYRLDALVAAVVTSAKLINGKGVAQAAEVQTYEAAWKAFQRTGPVVSGRKESTVAPSTWTDDDLLRAGHQATIQPARLFMDTPNNKQGKINTKHQLVVNGVLVEAIREEGTKTPGVAGGPPTVVPGRVTSVYPTVYSTIPDLPDPGKPEGMGFFRL